MLRLDYEALDQVALLVQVTVAPATRFWLNMQTQYDLEKQRDKLAERLTEEVKVLTTQ